MAGKYTGLQKTYQIENSTGVALYTGVTYGTAEGSVKVPNVDNAVFVGVVDNDERVNDPFRAGGDQSGRNVAVQVDGYAEIKLTGNAAYGDRLILAANGYAKKLPTGTGAYEVATITVTAAATTSGNVTVNLDGTAKTVAVLDTDTTAAGVATKIATAIDALAGYSASATDAVVTVTAGAKGDQTDLTFDGGTTGVTATVAVTTQGVADNSGVYNVIGYAEKNGVNGDVIPVKIAPHTVVIS